MSRFQFVEDSRNTFEVARLCEAVEVARSSYYDWRAAAGSRAARAAADEALAARIADVQDPAKGGDPAYGVPRVTAELNDGKSVGERVNHKKVARVMRGHGLAGIRLRRRVRTTVPDQSNAKHPDLLGRDFTADAPNKKYVGDITYLPIADGTNLYLATVIDCGSRRLPGWALADHMRTELVEDALRAANNDRAPLNGLRGAIFHSDHGSVYTSKDFGKVCKRLGVTQSMGAIGSSADNALAESWNAALKRELLAGRQCFADEAEARRAVFRWANRYNTRRRHSYCGYDTPNNFEHKLTITQKQLLQLAA